MHCLLRIRGEGRFKVPNYAKHKFSRDVILPRSDNHKGESCCISLYLAFRLSAYTIESQYKRQAACREVAGEVDAVEVEQEGEEDPSQLARL